MSENEFTGAKKSIRKTKRLCVSIDENIYDRFKHHCDASGYDTSKLVEKILEKFLNTRVSSEGNG